MPEMTGLELRDTLAAQGRNIPIIFITGHSDVAMAVLALARDRDRPDPAK